MQYHSNSSFPWVLRLSFVILATITIAFTSQAQTVNSLVEGIVQDTSGAVVPGAELALTNVNTGVKQTTQSNNDGRYVFPSVPVGEYSLRVSKKGFQTYVLSEFTVVVSQQVTENVVLKVGAVTQSVTVQAGGLTPLLQPSSNELGTLISPRQVEQLPLNGRNFLQLGLLSGATQSSGPSGGNGDFVSAQGGHPARAINVGGNQQDLTSYLINGMATSGSRMGNVSLDPSIAGIDQFKVRHGFFLPGLGPDPGIVNVITKSGTNRIHGQAFEFLRNNALDARGFFDTVSPPPFRRNQFGGAAGGPIIKNRLFVFGDFEALRQVRINQGRGFTPSAKMFNGDFSELLPNTVIYDPSTFNPSTGLRQAFNGNIIPPGEINSVAKNLLAYYASGSSFASQPFNFFTSVPTRFNANKGTLRVDASLTPRNQIFGQFSEEDSPVVDAGLFPLSGRAFPLNTKLATVQWTSSLNPRMVNELRVGWTRDLVFDQGETAANLAPQLGIPGTADPNGVPGIGMTGFSGFGRSAGNLGNIDNLYQIHDSFNYLRGKHQIQFGADVRYVRSIQQSANANARGNIHFTPTFTSQFSANGPVAGTGNAFADFLLGMPTNGQVVSMPRTHYRWTQFEPYVQDSWKIRPDLTLNLGFSWYLATPPNPSGGDKNFPHAVDFKTGKVLFSALNQVSPEIYQTDYNNFIPRIGLAWQPSFVKNTVFRAGWGIYYASQRMLDQQFSIVAPGITITQSFANSQLDPTASYMMGQNVFPPLTLAPVTPEFADNLTGTVFAYDTGARTPYVEQWTAGIQHTFGSRDLVEVDYLGSEGHKLNRRTNANDCSVPGSLVCDPSVIPFSQYPFILFASNSGNSNYQGLVAKFQHQFSQGFTFLANYTYSKVLTNSMEGGAAGTLSQIAACPQCDKGLAAFNVPQRFIMSGIWQLPFGQGKRFLANANPFVNHVIGGWQADAITTFSGGNPFTVSAPNTSGAVFTNFRANRLCNGRSELTNTNLRANGGYFLDPSCFGRPTPGLFGTSGFDILSGPGINNWDVGLLKDIPIRESLRMQFRTEFFNAFNHAQFANPDAGVADTNFGKVTGTQVSAREIQFALKVLW